MKEVENYIEFLKSKSRAKATIQQSRSIIRKYIDRFGSLEVSKKEIYQYYRELEMTLAESALYGHIRVLRHFYRYVCNENSRISNPFAQFKPRAPKRKPVRVFYVKEIEYLYAQISQNNRISDYQCFLFEFIYTTGMKPSEMRRLELSDFDFVARSM